MYKLPPQNGIVGSGEEYVERVYLTEVSNVHPLEHALRVCGIRPDFAVVWSAPIDKKIYEFVMGNQPGAVKRAVQIAEQVIGEQHEN